MEVVGSALFSLLLSLWLWWPVSLEDHVMLVVLGVVVVALLGHLLVGLVHHRPQLVQDGLVFDVVGLVGLDVFHRVDDDVGWFVVQHPPVLEDQLALDPPLRVLGPLHLYLFIK